ncbi:MAG: hypothetical protein Q8L43_03555 [Deltaproteobacteria bacterium]|nr:hypothetical protein [Deltaproteobacteria bacterium]
MSPEGNFLSHRLGKPAPGNLSGLDQPLKSQEKIAGGPARGKDLFNRYLY